jgi:hypothetical protein
MENLSTAQLEIASGLWPKKFFASDEAWLAYVSKWFNKIIK